jgi:glycosyltransferase involved in cell wall biosynthesis
MKIPSNRICLICYNVVKGGGISVVFSVFEYLLKKNVVITLLCPGTPLYRDFMKKNDVKSKGWVVHYFPLNCNLILFKPIINYLFLPLYAYFNGCQVICNLGNVAFPSNKKQFLLMHNAFAVSDEKQLLGRYRIDKRIMQKLMNKFILFNIRFATTVAVQTYTIKAQLKNMTGINADVIPNISLPRDIANVEIVTPTFSRDNIKMLFLSKYYIHKNFDSLIYLAEIIKKRELKISFTITFDCREKVEKAFLFKIKKMGLTDIIRNIGSVKSEDLMKVYLAHDALFLPTLMESYSGTYTEAFRFKRPIFTSDRAFAREVCGNGAFYFDPYDYEQIIDIIQNAFASPLYLQDMVNDNYNKLLLKASEGKFMAEMIYKKLF